MHYILYVCLGLWDLRCEIVPSEQQLSYDMAESFGGRLNIVLQVFKEGGSNLLAFLHVHVHYSITNTPNFRYIEHFCLVCHFECKPIPESRPFHQTGIFVCSSARWACRPAEWTESGQIQFSFTIVTLEVSSHVICKGLGQKFELCMQNTGLYYFSIATNVNWCQKVLMANAL